MTFDDETPRGGVCDEKKDSSQDEKWPSDRD